LPVGEDEVQDGGPSVRRIIIVDPGVEDHLVQVNLLTERHRQHRLPGRFPRASQYGIREFVGS
jgi:hypothetical protein